MSSRRRDSTVDLGYNHRASAPTHYLHRCFAAFREVTEKKYGTPFDLAAIEETVVVLRSRKLLRYDDLQGFESPAHWWFQKYWVFPPERHVILELERRTFNFWLLPKGEAQLVASLIEVFKSIELVSIILRFVRPEHYGILSPPVERVLAVRRGSNAVETYLNYLRDLRLVTRAYGFQRAADADMALWVLHERCFGDLRDDGIARAYADDRFMLRLRAKNLIAHFLTESSYAQLAYSLLPTNPDLAAQVAGIAFERMVRQHAAGLAAASSYEQDLKGIIDVLHDQGLINGLTRGLWQAARRTRNKAIHGTVMATAAEISRLLATLDLSPAEHQRRPR